MYQAVIALFAACLMVSSASMDVNTMCGADTCVDSVCRITGAEASCLPCVPAGVDAVCNIGGYDRAVLASSGGENPTWGARACDAMSECPTGSSCHAGVCCYGYNAPADGNIQTGSNNDPTC